MSDIGIYDIVYDKTAEICRDSGALMPYSKRVFHNWLCKYPVEVSEREFDIYKEDEDPKDLLDNIMYRCMSRFKPDHVANVYGRVMKDIKVYDPAAITHVMISILLHSAEATECGIIKANGENGYKPRFIDRFAVHHFLLYQLVAGFFYTYIAPVIKKKIIEPIWDSFSNGKKNRIRVFFGREAKQ